MKTSATVSAEFQAKIQYAADQAVTAWSKDEARSLFWLDDVIPAAKQDEAIIAIANDCFDRAKREFTNRLADDQGYPDPDYPMD